MQLLAEPIETALQLLQDRISLLEATIAQLKEENAALAATQATLSDNQLIQLRLVKQLQEAIINKEPGKTELSRAEKIERYLSSRPVVSRKCCNFVAALYPTIITLCPSLNTFYL